MKRCSSGICAAVILAFMLSLAVVHPAVAKEGGEAKPPALLTMGAVGKDSIGIRVWTDKPEGEPYLPDEPIVIHLKAEAKSYVTAVYVSSKGDAMILFPNKESADNELLPGKQYTLFGKDSNIQIRAGDKTKKARIVFYVSSSPVDLAPLVVAEGQACIVVRHDSAKEMEILTGKLKEMAKQKGFNRVVLGLKAGAEEEGLKLMGLPVGIKTSKPESITGVQGREEIVRDKIKAE